MPAPDPPLIRLLSILYKELKKYQSGFPREVFVLLMGAFDSDIH